MSGANVSASELLKFAAMSASWWDPEGSSRALHDLNPVRLAFVAAQCPLRGARVLDVGCGGGILSEALSLAGAQVTALDLSAELLEIARLHALESAVKIDYRLSSIEQFAAQAPSAFRLITCMEMLEHVPDPSSVLQACADLLEPGGMLVLSTINRTSKAFALGIVAAEYVLALLPRGTHEYRQFIKPSELSAAVRSVGLELTALKGMAYQPFTRRARLTSDLAVNYLLAARKPL